MELVKKRLKRLWQSSNYMAPEEANHYGIRICHDLPSTNRLSKWWLWKCTEALIHFPLSQACVSMCVLKHIGNMWNLIRFQHNNDSCLHLSDIPWWLNHQIIASLHHGIMASPKRVCKILLNVNKLYPGQYF